MIELVANAFECQNYHTAAKLLKQLVKESPENPWVQFYVGRLHEVSGQQQQAETVYRQLLRDTTNVKVTSQARQGLQRLQEIEQAERKRAIAQATANNAELGVLILEAINNELKTKAAQKLAQIMQLDPYNARLLLPSRGWRLFRSGAVGELKFYSEHLLNADIPCFWIKLAELEKIHVFQVKYFSELTPKISVICQNRTNQLGSLSFDWSEVKGRVQASLPIFEEVVDLNLRGKLERKTQTQDYFQFCDLHLPDRRCILRFYDNGYEFQQGVKIVDQAINNTIRINWNQLIGFFNQNLPQVKVWSDFLPFAETALDQTEVMNNIEAYIQVFRREKSNWDQAFQLYSGLVFLNSASKNE